MKLKAAAGLVTIGRTRVQEFRSSEGMPAIEPKSRRRLCAEFMDVDIEFLRGETFRFVKQIFPVTFLVIAGLSQGFQP
jgi:hypothetical protein